MSVGKMPQINSHSGAGVISAFALLARLEGSIAFRKLLPLLSGAKLATPTLAWRDSFMNHALESLPVRFSKGI